MAIYDMTQKFMQSTSQRIKDVERLTAILTVAYAMTTETMRMVDEMPIPLNPIAM